MTSTIKKYGIQEFINLIRQTHVHILDFASNSTKKCGGDRASISRYTILHHCVPSFGYWDGVPFILLWSELLVPHALIFLSSELTFSGTVGTRILSRSSSMPPLISYITKLLTLTSGGNQIHRFAPYCLK
jgi:hypothetical protein